MTEYPIMSAAGGLDVSHLHRLWARRVGPDGNRTPPDPVTEALDWALDRLVIFGLGLGLHETLQFLLSRRPSFPAFQAWILESHGGVVEPARIARVNAAVARALAPEASPTSGWPADGVPVLDESDLACWSERGYVVIPDSVPRAACQAAERAIWDYLGADPNAPDSWYDGTGREGITVTLVRHPAFDENRRSPRIRAAFAQLLGTHELQVTVDRGGFNPPERSNWRFPGSDLHWDTSIAPPMPLQVQGILYLTDTPADQGAFRCVPGFHRRLDTWLAGLPAGVDPRAHDFSAEAVPLAGKAGDFIIWHAALPHGASPNRGTRPRMVQYINFTPTDRIDRRPWR